MTSDPEFITLVDAMDACWTEKRFEDLHSYLATDVVLVAPGGVARIDGVDAAIDTYRQFMANSTLQRYWTRGHVVTPRGDAAVVEYEWEMQWASEGAEHNDRGREVLVFSKRDGKWKVVWRTQIATA